MLIPSITTFICFQTICRTMFSELVSIESQEENQFLTDLVKNETQADGAQSTGNHNNKMALKYY